MAATGYPRVDSSEPASSRNRKVVADLVSILAYLPERRWFVKDEDDEALLVSAAEGAFDQPVEPALHRDGCLQSCFMRTRSAGR